MSSQLPAFRAETAAFLARLVPFSLVPLVRATLLFDHGTIVRQTREMIGKVDRDQRSGVSDQKKNGLGARWKAFETVGGLDKSRDQGTEGTGEQGTRQSEGRGRKQRNL